MGRRCDKLDTDGGQETGKGGAGGVATVWDLATQHKTQGFTRTDHKVEKSIILGLSPSPTTRPSL